MPLFSWIEDLILERDAPWHIRALARIEFVVKRDISRSLCLSATKRKEFVDALCESSETIHGLILPRVLKELVVIRWDFLEAPSHPIILLFRL